MKNVLAVDDHPDTCQLLVKLLRIMDCPATCVQSGREALDQLKVKRPSLIILDVMMSEISGFDVLRELKNDPVLRDIPVVMHSAHDDPETRQLAMQFGAQGILPRPSLGTQRQEKLSINTSRLWNSNLKQGRPTPAGSDLLRN